MFIAIERLIWFVWEKINLIPHETSPHRWGGRRLNRAWGWRCRWPTAGWASPTLLWRGCSATLSTCGCGAPEVYTPVKHLHLATAPEDGQESSPADRIQRGLGPDSAEHSAEVRSLHMFLPESTHESQLKGPYNVNQSLG